MCPERRRRTVESVRRTLGQEKVSERRVCRVLGQNRGTQRNRPGKVDGDRELLGVMRKIVETFPRHGSERTHRVLTDPEAFGGWKVNIKRVLLTAVENGGAGRSKMVALGGVDLP